jgi:hypothetical protein
VGGGKKEYHGLVQFFALIDMEIQIQKMFAHINSLILLIQYPFFREC